MIDQTFSLSQEVILAPTLVERLIASFNQEAILYSHWKSNVDLEQAAAGEIDLDLLVERRSLPQMLAILTALGFKEAVARWGANPPGIRHYYGFDATTGQLHHVHLFGRVLTGESFVKSHLFPFEAMLLENVDDAGPIRVTARSAELVLFTLRMFVKYGSLPDLLHLWRKREQVKREACWLQAGGNLSRTLCLLRTYCPLVEEPLFIKCVKSLSGDGSLLGRVRLARQVRRRLKVYARHTAAGRLLAYGRLLGAEVRRRLGGKRKNKVLVAGGAMIAFVGAEATGKSTLVAETAGWLGSTFAIRTVHAGKPPATWLTLPFNLFLPLMRRRLPSLRTNHLDGHVAASPAAPPADKERGPASLVYGLRAVILAWERRQLLLGARRAAASGEIVICDRFPSDTVGAMDSPRLQAQPERRGVVSALFNGLAGLEHRLYRQIPPPDIVLRLNVSIEAALQRNRERFKPGKESDSYVASRHRQACAWHKAGTGTSYDINTELSLEETILCVKKAIWDSL